MSRRKKKLRYRVAELLADRGLVQSDLEPGCGVHRQTVYNGVKSRSTLCALAYFFGMTVEELVKGTEAEELWFRGRHFE